MPYEVIKNKNNTFQLKNLKTNKKIKVKYKSKENAINSAKNFMNYRKEKPVIRGNKILNSKKK